MAGMGVPVAKKKSELPDPEKSKPGPKPNPLGPRDAMIAVKCYREYRNWFDGFVQTEMRSPAVIVTQALAMYAKSKGYKPVPPKR